MCCVFITASVDEPSWPALRATTPPSPEAKPTKQSSSPDENERLARGCGSAPWVHAAEWGPVYGEEEDLDRAIQDSLRQTPNTGHMNSLSTASDKTDSPGIDGGPAIRRDMLVIGYHPPAHPQEQFVEHHVTTTSPLPAAPPSNLQPVRDSTLPSPIQQLLDSNIRIGTNV